MNLDEMLSREKIRVTVEVNGERREYTENFIVMHMGENCGTVMGCVGPMELVKLCARWVASLRQSVCWPNGAGQGSGHVDRQYKQHNGGHEPDGRHDDADNDRRDDGGACEE